MFTSSDSNLADLDFEIRNQSQRQQQQQETQRFFNDTMIKDFLSTSSPSSSTYRIAKTINTNKRNGNVQLTRQLTDEGTMRQQTPPNSMGNSLSPLSSSYLSRLSTSNEGSPSRATTNSVRLLNLPSNTKQMDPVASLLKQAIAPNQLIHAVQTRLENPTRYHLEQISRKHSDTNDDVTLMLPRTLQGEESSPDSEITSEMDDQLNDDTTCASLDSNSRGISIAPRLSNPTSNEPAFLSSSVSKDSFDSGNLHSSSCPTNILNAKAKIGLPLTDDEMRMVIRDRQKKDNHNMIERRRRFNINDRIKELGTLLPKGTELDMKQNKGTILRASVDYIKILRSQYDNAAMIDEKCQMLNEQNQALQERVRELEKQCLINGIPIDSPTRPTSSINVQSSNAVKQEPSSLSSSLTNAPNLLVPPSTPIYGKFDAFPTFDSLANFALVDEDSNETATTSGNPSNPHVDPLSSFAHDPYLSSTLFGFDQEMDIGGAFP